MKCLFTLNYSTFIVKYDNLVLMINNSITHCNYPTYTTTLTVGISCAFTEIEILNDTLGKPFIEVTGKIKQFITDKNITKIHISMSHLKDVANAIVLLE